MDGITMTASSQSFFLAKKSALMAMTVTALTITVNVDADNVSRSTTSNGNFLAYTNSASVTPISQDKIYFFPKRKNFRARYSRLSQTKWFKDTYNGKTLGEILTVEE